jgi:catechol 2,3-dioxygenase-like lactoylglutathione lyase family enzyme
MITQVRHVGVVVKDLEKSLYFYKDLLGLKIRKEMEEEGAYIDIVLGLKKVLLKTVKLAPPPGGAGVELLYYVAPASAQRTPCAINERAITHFALTIEGLDQEYGRLLGQGVKFISPPQVSLDGGAKVAFCQDPDGNYIELTEEIRKHG